MKGPGSGSGLVVVVGRPAAGHVEVDGVAAQEGDHGDHGDRDRGDQGEDRESPSIRVHAGSVGAVQQHAEGGLRHHGVLVVAGLGVGDHVADQEVEPVDDRVLGLGDLVLDPLFVFAVEHVGILRGLVVVRWHRVAVDRARPPGVPGGVPFEMQVWAGDVAFGADLSDLVAGLDLRAGRGPRAHVGVEVGRPVGGDDLELVVAERRPVVHMADGAGAGGDHAGAGGGGVVLPGVDPVAVGVLVAGPVGAALLVQGGDGIAGDQGSSMRNVRFTW